MTERGYAVAGGNGFEREALAAAAPPGWTRARAGRASPVVLLHRLGSGVGEADAPAGDGPVIVVVIGIETLPGFAAFARTLGADDRGRAFGVEAQGSAAAAALTAHLARDAAGRAAAERDPERRAALLTFGASFCDARGEIERLTGGMGGVAGAFVAALPREPVTFSRLVQTEDSVREPLFVEGLFDMLATLPPPAARRVPRPAAAFAAAALLLLGLVLAVPAIGSLASARALQRAARAAEAAQALVAAHDPATRVRAATAYRSLADRMEAIGDARAGLARARASALVAVEVVASPIATSAPPQPEPPAADLAPVAFAGSTDQAYAAVVLPACEAATRDRFPFFGSAGTEATAADFRRAFAPGGVLHSFVRERLAPHIDRSGPVWRWRKGDAAAAQWDPDTPAAFALASALGTLAERGADYRISVKRTEAGVDAAEIDLGSGPMLLRPGEPARALRWLPVDRPEPVRLRLMRGGRPLYAISVSARWAPVRLAGQGVPVGGNPRAAEIRFGSGETSATLVFASDSPLFGRAGLWTFRCPARL